MNVTPLDLKKSFPRSPKEVFGGYAHLARMMDKARAKAAGLEGEYIYPCPLDQSLLDFLGLGAEDFSQAAEDRSDEEMLKWTQDHAINRSDQDIEKWNKAFLNRTPSSEESMKHFLEIRNQLAPHRTDITTWPDLIDLEEGR